MLTRMLASSRSRRAERAFSDPKVSPHGSSRVANEAGGGRQAARVGHAKSGGESTAMSLGSGTQACFVSPSTV
jgi:hypothetical protein